MAKPTKVAQSYAENKKKINEIKIKIIERYKSGYGYETLLIPYLQKITFENLYTWFVNNKSIFTAFKLGCEKWNKEDLIRRINVVMLLHILLFYSRTSPKGKGLSALNFYNFKRLLNPQMIAYISSLGLAGYGLKQNLKMPKGKLHTRGTALTMISLYTVYLLFKHRKNTLNSLAELFVQNKIVFNDSL